MIAKSMTKSIRCAVFALFTLATVSLVQPAGGSSTEEILVGNGGAYGNSDETVAIQSSGNAELDVKNEKSDNFQSSARFFVGGAEFAGGYTNMSSETSLKAACSYASSVGVKPGRIKYLCQDGLKSLDAAAKVLGVPAVVIACIEVEFQRDDSNGDFDLDDKRTEKEIEQERKAKDAKREKLKQHYSRIKGGSKPDEIDHIFESAYDYFWMLETVAKAMKQSLMEKDPTEAYWDLVKFAVLTRFAGRETAKQFLETGRLPSNVKDSQLAFASVKKCIEAARAQHDNKSK